MHSFKELVGKFEERFLPSALFPAVPHTLYEPCRYILSLGGKRIRPILCLMGNELIGDLKEDAWQGAAAIELFHNYTLIHDDIMDHAPLRRGKPTIHARYGLTSGILSGDVMSIYAYEQLAQIKQPLAPVLSLFNKTAIQVCEGQQLDMDFELRDDVSIDEYIHMITLKTSVLLACSLKMGALLGGSTGGNADKLYEFGKNLGIAFQLKDDYLDAFGDADRLGKQQGGDIKANKKTYLLLTALQNANESHKKEIAYWLQNEGDEKVHAMLSIFTESGADTACHQAVEHYSKRAFDCLEDVAVLSKRKTALHELATYLLQRDK